MRGGGEIGMKEREFSRELYIAAIHFSSFHAHRLSFNPCHIYISTCCTVAYSCGRESLYICPFCAHTSSERYTAGKRTFDDPLFLHRLSFLRIFPSKQASWQFRSSIFVSKCEKGVNESYSFSNAFFRDFLYFYSGWGNWLVSRFLFITDINGFKKNRFHLISYLSILTVSYTFRAGKEGFAILTFKTTIFQIFVESLNRVLSGKSSWHYSVTEVFFDVGHNVENEKKLSQYKHNYSSRCTRRGIATLDSGPTVRVPLVAYFFTSFYLFLT